MLQIKETTKMMNSNMVEVDLLSVEDFKKLTREMGGCGAMPG
jgi:hypothetical protein